MSQDFLLLYSFFISFNPILTSNLNYNQFHVLSSKYMSDHLFEVFRYLLILSNLKNYSVFLGKCQKVSIYKGYLICEFMFKNGLFLSLLLGDFNSNKF